jgi:hypothetical protein
MHAARLLRKRLQRVVAPAEPHLDHLRSAHCAAYGNLPLARVRPTPGITDRRTSGTARKALQRAGQPDQGSLFGLDLKNDKPDNIAEAIIGDVDLGRAEKIARAILKAVKAKSQKPAG